MERKYPTFQTEGGIFFVCSARWGLTNDYKTTCAFGLPHVVLFNELSIAKLYFFITRSTYCMTNINILQIARHDRKFHYHYWTYICLSPHQ